jgi:alpha-tubulin suppressor-like RCC1 family protein
MLCTMIGPMHTVCVMKDGSAMSFGKGQYYALGFGERHTHDQMTPMAITSLGTNIQTCSAGTSNVNPAPDRRFVFSYGVSVSAF